MTRRVRLPGADELFRVTGSLAERSVQQDDQSRGLTALSDGSDRAEAVRALSTETPPANEIGAPGQEGARGGQPRSSGVRHTGRRRTHDADRQPSGRERHDEKITVYCSAEELIDLEHARLALRGEHGLAVDRGRIVREALAVVIADLDAKGESSILVRRLRGR